MRPLLSAALTILLGSVILAPANAKAPAGRQDQGDKKPIKENQLRVEADLQKLDAKMAELIDQLRKKDAKYIGQRARVRILDTRRSYATGQVMQGNQRGE